MKFFKAVNDTSNLQIQNEPENEKKGILIVDDSRFSRNILRDILKNEGYLVIGEAGDGLEAVEIAKGKRPEFVFMDVEMPRLDGLGAIPKILEIDPSIHIIMCTALGQKKIIVEAAKAGAKDYVIKPYKKENIMGVLSVISNTHQRDGQVIPFKAGKKHPEEEPKPIIDEDPTPTVDELDFKVDEEVKFKDGKMKEEFPDILIDMDEFMEPLENVYEMKNNDSEKRMDSTFESEKLKAEIEKYMQDTYTNELPEVGTSDMDKTKVIDDLHNLEIKDVSVDIKDDLENVKTELWSETESNEEVLPEAEENELEDDSLQELWTIETLDTNDDNIGSLDTSAFSDVSEGKAKAEPEIDQWTVETLETKEEALPEDIKKATEMEYTYDEIGLKETKDFVKAPFTKDVTRPEMDFIESPFTEDEIGPKKTTDNYDAAKESSKDDFNVLDGISFEYLWNDRFAINQEDISIPNPTSQRISFYRYANMEKEIYGLLGEDNSEREIMLGMINAYMSLDNRLQQREAVAFGARTTAYEQSERLFTESLLNIDRKKIVEINIADTLRIPGNRMQKTTHGNLKKNSLYIALSSMVTEKCNRVFG